MFKTFASCLSILLAPAILGAQQRIEYEVSFPNADNHEARVTATFRGVGRSTPLQARMARSSPGRYSPTGFAKNVYDVRAVDGRGRALAMTRPHPHGWDVGGHDGVVTLTYKVWGDRIDGTYLSVDHSHAHMNIPATFMFAPRMSSAPIRLRIVPRPGWRVATQLFPTADSTVFTAPNMQYFMDSPTEVAPVMLSSWQHSIGGRTSTLRLAVHHLGTQAQVDSLAFLARRVAAEQFAIWGEAPGFDGGTFTFINDYLPWAGGDGMEHRNSTVISTSGSIATHEDRLRRLGTISHELFHAWNMERLRSDEIEPFDFERDNMSSELWFGEGFTNYYGSLAIRRAGLITTEQFVDAMGGEVLGITNSPGRLHGSAVTMSRLAPFFDGATWRDPVNIANTFVSYYSWGQTIAFALDLMLRTRYSTTLDDYMRLLWQSHGRHQSRSFAPLKPYSMADLKSALARLTRDTRFANDFFARYVEGSEMPDYAPLLAPAGILVRTDAAKPYAGGTFDQDTARIFVNFALENGSLWTAGIANGDYIHSIDGVATTTVDIFNRELARKVIGSTASVEVTQHGVRRTVSMRIVGMPVRQIITYEKAGMPVTDEIRRFREAWLGSKAI